MPLSQVDEYYAEASALPQLEMVGLSTHIGSQITETAPFTEAGQQGRAIVGRLRSAGIALKYLDLGGGLGIPYQEQPPPPSEYAQRAAEADAGLGLKIITEPGRVMVGNAGVLVTRVLYIKETDVKRFVVIDGAMNDLIRPVLYEAYHEIVPVDRRKPGQTRDRRISSARFARAAISSRASARWPEPAEGDLLAVMSAGAYGFVMSSNYNSRPRAPEVLIDGADVHVIRERDSFEDLVRDEHIVDLKTA